MLSWSPFCWWEIWGCGFVRLSCGYKLLNGGVWHRPSDSTFLAFFSMLWGTDFFFFCKWVFVLLYVIIRSAWCLWVIDFSFLQAEWSRGEWRTCLAFLPSYYFMSWHFLTSVVLKMVIGGSQISSQNQFTLQISSFILMQLPFPSLTLKLSLLVISPSFPLWISSCQDYQNKLNLSYSFN